MKKATKQVAPKAPEAIYFWVHNTTILMDDDILPAYRIEVRPEGDAMYEMTDAGLRGDLYGKIYRTVEGNREKLAIERTLCVVGFEFLQAALSQVNEVVVPQS